MNYCSLNEAPCFKPLLGLEFMPDLNWNSFIWSSATNARKVVSSLWLIHSVMLYIYKKIKSNMEYFAVIFRMDLHNPPFPALKVLNSFTMSSLENNIFSTPQPLSHIWKPVATSIATVQTRSILQCHQLRTLKPRRGLLRPQDWITVIPPVFLW